MHHSKYSKVHSADDNVYSALSVTVRFLTPDRFSTYLLFSCQPLNSDESDSTDSCCESLCSRCKFRFLYRSSPCSSELSSWRNPDPQTVINVNGQWTQQNFTGVIQISAKSPIYLFNWTMLTFHLSRGHYGPPSTKICGTLFVHCAICGFCCSQAVVFF